MKTLAIVILDWNGAEDTIDCLSSLNNDELYDIYLLDNGSHPSNINKVLNFLEKSIFAEKLKLFRDDSFKEGNNSFNYILLTHNLGFAGGNNYVVSRICRKYQYILLLNNDTVVPEGTIQHMVKTAYDKKTIALTCDIRLFSHPNTLWNAGGNFTFYGDRKYFSQQKIDNLKRLNVKYINAEFITGCALLICSEYISNNGLFTEKFFHGEEDFNFCYNLKLKKCIVGVDLNVVLYHKVGKSINRIKYSKDYNKILLHYANRVIDFKGFYSIPKWLFWRELYLFLVFICRLTTGMKYKDAFLLIKRIKAISDESDSIPKPLFDKIMSLDWHLD